MEPSLWFTLAAISFLAAILLILAEPLDKPWWNWWQKVRHILLSTSPEKEVALQLWCLSVGVLGISAALGTAEVFAVGRKYCSGILTGPTIAMGLVILSGWAIIWWTPDTKDGPKVQHSMYRLFLCYVWLIGCASLACVFMASSALSAWGAQAHKPFTERLLKYREVRSDINLFMWIPAALIAGGVFLFATQTTATENNGRGKKYHRRLSKPALLRPYLPRAFFWTLILAACYIPVHLNLVHVGEKVEAVLPNPAEPSLNQIDQWLAMREKAESQLELRIEGLLGLNILPILTPLISGLLAGILPGERR